MITEDYPDRPVWFEEGLRFECIGCGACCMGPPGGRVCVDEVEIARISEYLGLSKEEFHRTHLRPDGGGWSLLERPNGDCEFLIDGRCSIQPVKPRQCQTYPFWFNNIRTPQAWAETARACPGIGLGRLYSRAEIIEIALGGQNAAPGVDGHSPSKNGNS